MELTREEQALLRAVHELQAELGDPRVPDTEMCGRRMNELLKAEGQTYTLSMKPPWYGTHEAARRLEELGLLEIDPGMASFVPRGQPAPTMERLALALTSEGRKLAESLTNED